MKRTIAAAALLFSLLLCVGCATYINMRVLKPAQLSIPPFKKIAVFDFDCTGSFKFWYDAGNKELSFEDIAKKALLKTLGLETGGGPARPDPRTAFPGSAISAKIITDLVQNGFYEVLERTQLEKIMAEHRLTMTGLVDESQAAQIGKLLGVDAIMLGSSAYSMSDAGEWYEYTEQVKTQVPGDSGKTVTVEQDVKRRAFRATRHVSLDVNYRIVEIATGRIVAAQSNRSSRRLVSERPTPEEACTNLPEWRPALDAAADNIAASTVLQIAPYYVYQSRKLEKGSAKNMQQALEYAKRGMMDDARGLWEQSANDQSAKAVKDRVAAMYNLGVYAELSDDLDKAESLFDQCYKLTGKGKYLDARAGIQGRKDELRRLREQNAVE